MIRPAFTRRAWATFLPFRFGTTQRICLGGRTAMTNGPRWLVAVQLPALSRVRRWKYQLPFESAGLVVPVAVSSASLTVSGTETGWLSQWNEKPSMPLWLSVAPLQVRSIVRSVEAAPAVWLGALIAGGGGACSSTAGGGGGGGAGGEGGGGGGGGCGCATGIVAVAGVGL